MNLQAETMAGGVRKSLRQSCPAQYAASCLVHLRTANARSHCDHRGLLRLQYRLIGGSLTGLGLAQVHGSGHIRAISIENNTEIEGHKASAGQLGHRSEERRVG